MTKEERKAYNKQYYLDNKEKILAYHKQWNLDNKEKKAARNKQWRQDNAERLAPMYAAKRAKRRAAKLQRTVGWSDKLVIDMIYADCPEGYHVDHIIPLQGEKVSGLHVAWNLQYLTAEENLSKGNKHL